MTKYQKISLDIPVCAGCRGRSLRWFAGAIGAGALALALLEWRPQAANFAAFLLVCAVLAGILGGLYNRKFAAALERAEGAPK